MNTIKIMSFNEALKYLDVSASFLYKLTSKRRISFSKPNGGKIYFRKSDLDEWMMQNRVLSKDEMFKNLKERK